MQCFGRRLCFFFSFPLSGWLEVIEVGRTCIEMGMYNIYLIQKWIWIWLSALASAINLANSNSESSQALRLRSGNKYLVAIWDWYFIRSLVRVNWNWNGNLQPVRPVTGKQKEGAWGMGRMEAMAIVTATVTELQKCQGIVTDMARTWQILASTLSLCHSLLLCPSSAKFVGTQLN